jgi:hypothetical protein
MSQLGVKRRSATRAVAVLIPTIVQTARFEISILRLGAHLIRIT